MKCDLFYCCLWAVLFDVWFHAKQRIAVLLQTNGCLLVCIKLQEKGDLLFGCCSRRVLCSLIFVASTTKVSALSNIAKKKQFRTKTKREKGKKHIYRQKNYTNV